MTDNVDIILQTARLTLRRFVPQDLDDLLALYADPEVTRHIPDAPTTPEGTVRELAWHISGPDGQPELGLWATIHRDTGAIIGRCGLLPWALDGKREVEVAYLFARQHWGQGLATEAARALRDHAFGKLNLTRLVCLIQHGHGASIRVAEKIGMRFEREGQDDAGPFLLYGQERDTRR